MERTLFGAFADAAGTPTQQTEQTTLDADWDARMPRVGAILDGPSDYITKALGTFEAPAVPVPAHVVTQVKGDQHCGSVACAAVLAKVTRDRLMTQLADSNPDYARYGWAHNKGYGSQAHKAAIAQYGPCDEHRTSWKLL